jgi:hypothetical protein
LISLSVRVICLFAMTCIMRDYSDLSIRLRLRGLPCIGSSE